MLYFISIYINHLWFLFFVLLLGCCMLFSLRDSFVSAFLSLHIIFVLYSCDVWPSSVTSDDRHCLHVNYIFEFTFIC